MKPYLLILLAVIFSACQKDTIDVSNQIDQNPLPSDKTTWWQPEANVSFDWYLDDLEDGDTFDATVVDVDAFTTTAAQVSKLHAQGKKVIAYLSVGTIEDDRPDVSLLPAEVVGKKYPEWPHEKWLDIRQLEKLKPWLNSRYNMIIAKGFDAIEPDNLDSYSNESGFKITEDDTRKYCDLLISLAHKNGLGIGQKNVPEISAEYSKKFDWVLTEDAFDQGWQNQLQPYTLLHKPVFAVEYTDETSQSKFSGSVCLQAKTLGYFALLKKRSLDKWKFNCK